MMKLLNMKMRLLVVAVVTAPGLVAATPTISGVTAQQRYPWNGKVDISYTVTGDIAAEAKQKALLTSLKVSATDNIANETYTATKLSGDLALTAGAHKLVWDLDAEGLSFKSSDVIFKVSCETAPATYCVIDLSAGANASSYPVTYLASPPSGGFNVDAYKKTKLVLRRLEAGTYKMQNSSNVKLTKPFFCGVFEVTQKQYALVTGSNPSIFSGDTLPVDNVSYNTIRGSSNGANWPLSSTVDSSSFLGKFRARTGLDFDIPTEAQWEYACRAGTTTTYYWGNYMDNNYAWYSMISERKTHPVGSKLANAWELYDMSGNVMEWCLDWCGALSYGTDPKGASSGMYRTTRGGGWVSPAEHCTSSYRNEYSPSYDDYYNGFRLFRTLPSADTAGSLCSGVSVAMKIDTIPGVRMAAATEEIFYSTSWVGGTASDAKAVVTVNDETIKSEMGSGYVEWSPTRNGTYTLTHKVMSSDTQIGETFSATFFAVLPDVIVNIYENKSVTIPSSWITEHGLEVAASAMCDMSANGHNKVWECFVAGISPTNETSRFSAKIEMRDGLPVLTWEPDLNENGTKSERLYKVYGKESLSDADWVYPTNSLHRFFKVTVEMP